MKAESPQAPEGAKGTGESPFSPTTSFPRLLRRLGRGRLGAQSLDRCRSQHKLPSARKKGSGCCCGVWGNNSPPWLLPPQLLPSQTIRPLFCRSGSPCVVV